MYLWHEMAKDGVIRYVADAMLFFIDSADFTHSIGWKQRENKDLTKFKDWW